MHAWVGKGGGEFRQPREGACLCLAQCFVAAAQPAETAQDSRSCPSVNGLLQGLYFTNNIILQSFTIYYYSSCVTRVNVTARCCTIINIPIIIYGVLSIIVGSLSTLLDTLEDVRVCLTECALPSTPALLDSPSY